MSRPTYKNLRTELKERGDIELIKREGKQIWVKTQSCLDREKCITIADDDLDNDDDLSPEDLAKLESELEDDPFA